MYLVNRNVLFNVLLQFIVKDNNHKKETHICKSSKKIEIGYSREYIIKTNLLALFMWSLIEAGIDIGIECLNECLIEGHNSRWE